jgi:hypothetical protein
MSSRRESEENARSLTKSPGIQVFRFQPGLRQQPSLHSHLGEARIQRHWTRPQGSTAGEQRGAG